MLVVEILLFSLVTGHLWKVDTSPKLKTFSGGRKKGAKNGRQMQEFKSAHYLTFSPFSLHSQSHWLSICHSPSPSSTCVWFSHCWSEPFILRMFDLDSWENPVPWRAVKAEIFAGPGTQATTGVEFELGLQIRSMKLCVLL